MLYIKIRKSTKIRNQYNQATHLTQDTNGKVITSQLDITNESQEVSPFEAGDHQILINRRARKHNKNKTENNINNPQKSTALERSVKYFTGGIKPVSRQANLTLSLDVDQDTWSLICIKYPCLINASAFRTYKSRYKTEINESLNHILDNALANTASIISYFSDRGLFYILDIPGQGLLRRI